MPDYDWTGGDLPNFVSHLECGLTGERYEAGRLHGLSRAGRPLLVRYDLNRVRRALPREALAGRPRNSYILATKVFGDMGGGDQGLSAKQIEKQLDASLKRLKTDFVDLYQCHRYDTNTPLAETMEALERQVMRGLGAPDPYAPDTQDDDHGR